MADDPTKLSLLNLLELHSSADAREAADVQTIQRMIRAHPDILRRDCRAGHLTGSALVMDSTTGRVLLHYHKKLDRWLQFGGHMEDGEIDPAQTALREAREESGLPDLRHYPNPAAPRPLDIDIHLIPAKGDMPEHPHLDFRYLLLTDQPDAVQASAGESDRFLWCTPQTLSVKVDPALQRLISKAAQLYSQFRR